MFSMVALKGHRISQIELNEFECGDFVRKYVRILCEYIWDAVSFITYYEK